MNRIGSEGTDHHEDQDRHDCQVISSGGVREARGLQVAFLVVAQDAPHEKQGDEQHDRHDDPQQQTVEPVDIAGEFRRGGLEADRTVDRMARPEGPDSIGRGFSGLCAGGKAGEGCGDSRG